MIFQACCKLPASYRQVILKLSSSYPQVTLKLSSSYPQVAWQLQEGCRAQKKLQESCTTIPNVRIFYKRGKEKGRLEWNNIQLYGNVNIWKEWNGKALLLLDFELAKVASLLLKSCKKVAKAREDVLPGCLLF